MNQRILFKPALLSLAIASAICSNIAAAQESSEEAQEITITGIRASLMRAQALKMENTSIVEAISAEDIGKLPDSSIAESLSRLPGLAGERRGGRVSYLPLRSR